MMRRRELETILRAASKVARDREFFLIGSQAFHATCRRAPAEVLLSLECHLYPTNRPETANLLANELGENSEFARRNGFYADIVTPDIATLPSGWKRRLKPFRTGTVTAFCLDLYDLIVGKLVAARLKDLEFIGALLRLRLADHKLIQRRITRIPSSAERARLRLRLRLLFAEVSSE
jgi:hypothetical protein